MTQENSAGFFFAQTRTKIENYLVQKQTLYLHISLFMMALLVGIARYSRAIPQGLIILMTVWSVALLIHGVLVYRAQTAKQMRTVPRDGILNAVLAFTTINGMMWLMWVLATDGRDAGVWHTSFFLVAIMLGAIGVIVGKRALYRHWLNEYLREFGEQPGGTKRKRLTKLADDGELDTSWIDEDDQDRTSSSTR